MIPIARSPENPLNKYRDGCVAGPAAQPVPLVTTRMSVSIRGGLAFVTTARMFRNDEDASIEATITFPVPVDATLTGLTARIGDRVLTGRAKARDEARDTYETAIDEGRSAVLHEEALRGIHVLSIAHVPPGAEIVVESRHVQALSFVGEVARLRIPTSVGQIYGISPLLDSDDLVTGTVVHEAEIEIVCEDGKASLDGVTLDKGRARVRLDRPLDISIADFVTRPLSGSGAGGKAVTVNVTPAARATAPLDVSILVDRSGSMDGLPFEVLRGGLGDALVALNAEDRVRLFEFSERVAFVGAGTGPKRAAALTKKLTSPGGGTEIGGALKEVAGLHPSGDVLIATDGLSHALNVQALAATGCRFSVVLIGEGSLEARIGHLAALTGGEIFAVPAAATGEAMRAALNGLRTFNRRPEVRLEEPAEIEVQRAGTTIHIRWHAAEANTSVDDVGAFAAGLALPALPEDAAAEWAERHGIVSYLTSLFLVDDASEAQEGLPITRKVPLMAFEVRSMRYLACDPLEATAPLQASKVLKGLDAVKRRRDYSNVNPARSAEIDAAEDKARRTQLARLYSIEIDWNAEAERLREGDLARLSMLSLLMLIKMMDDRKLSELAQAIGIAPSLLAVALLAHRDAATDRAAARLFRALVPKPFRTQAKELAVRHS